MIQANDPALKSWVPVETGSDFPIQNLPFGVMRIEGGEPRLASAIGNKVIDLAALSHLGYFDALGIDHKVFANRYLNDFLALGKEQWRAVRQRLSDLLRAENPELRDSEAHCARVLADTADVEMLMPVKVGNYTDFYSSKEHATNVGTMFRDPDNALLPNWKHLPVGYHGRASSIIPSGQAIYRPKGQTRPQDDEPPVFGPSRLLDFELEMAFITGTGKPLGQRISVEEADNYIFGLVLFNDWSARDIQKWEYVPLGPFLAKSFASSISLWVVTLDALEAFRTAGPEQDVEVLPYLQSTGSRAIDINLEVSISPEHSEATRVCQSNYKYLYWNMEQQLAHQSVNGCNICTGDMYASGTISGPEPEMYGSMLELSWRGTKPLSMKDGSTRKFIEDGDTVTMRAWAERNGIRVGFGEVSTKVLPALD